MVYRISIIQAKSAKSHQISPKQIGSACLTAKAGIGREASKNILAAFISLIEDPKESRYKRDKICFIAYFYINPTKEELI